MLKVNESSDDVDLYSVDSKHTKNNSTIPAMSLYIIREIKVKFVL